MAKQKDRVGLSPIIPKSPKRRRRYAPGEVVVSAGWAEKLMKAEERADKSARELLKLLKRHGLNLQYELIYLRFFRRGEREGDEGNKKRHRGKMLKRFGNGNGPLEDEADPTVICIAVLNKYASVLERAIQEIRWDKEFRLQLEEQEEIRKKNQRQWREKMQKRSAPLQLEGSISV